MKIVKFTDLLSLNNLLCEFKLALPNSSGMSNAFLMSQIFFLEREVEKAKKGLPCGFLLVDPKLERI